MKLPSFLSIFFFQLKFFAIYILKRKFWEISISVMVVLSWQRGTP